MAKMTKTVSEERLDELYSSYEADKRIQEQFGDGDYANESGDIMSIISEIKSLRARLAELHEQKPFMYGIADPDGNAYFDECCVGDAGLMRDEVASLNDSLEDGDPQYSVVELFRHPLLPATMLADAPWLNKDGDV